VRRVLTASIVGSGNAGDDASAERVDNCEVVQPLGLFARPVLTALTEGVVARLADRPLILAMIDKGRAPQAVEEGETRLYGVGGDNAAAVVRLRADGSIEVTSLSDLNISLTAGGAGIVRFQDGSQAFLRGNQFASAINTFALADTSCLSALTTVMTAVGVFATAVGVATPAVAGAAVTLNTAIGAFASATGTRSGAITTLDNATTASLSTKVKGQ
jgi:hypothetical protein